MDKQPTPYQHTLKSKCGTLQNRSQFQSQNGQIYGHVFHDTNGPNRGQTLNIEWFLLNEFFRTVHLLVSCGKGPFEKVLLGLGSEKVPNWECPLLIEKKRLFLSENVEEEYGSHVEEIDERRCIISWPRVTWGVLNVNANRKTSHWSDNMRTTPERNSGTRSSNQEPAGKKSQCGEESGRMPSVERSWTMFERRLM